MPASLDLSAFGLGIVELTLGLYRIGREPNLEVTIGHPSLSRHHADLLVKESGFRLVDHGSKNGTFVDGERVSQTMLRVAHTLKFGEAEVPFSPGAGQARLLPLATLVVPAFDGELGLKQLLGAGASAAERLSVLLRVTELLAIPMTPTETLSEVLELAKQVLRATRACVVVGGQVTHLDNAGPNAAAPYSQTVISQTVIELVRTEGAAMLFNDVEADHRVGAANSLQLRSVTNCMAMPLSRKRDHGILYVEADATSRAEPWGGDDLELFAAFGQQATVALDQRALAADLAQRTREQEQLERFFPTEVASEVLATGFDADAVIEREATVLFCDLSGFTELATRLGPTATFRLLKAYFPPMAEVVFQFGGTVEKYVGDALLAVWGAPVKRPLDQEHAVVAAAMMQRRLQKLKQDGIVAADLSIHIGIRTGTVAAGSLGSARYLQYATIGDATNSASRICGVAGPGQIVVDAATLDHLDTSLRQLIAPAASRLGMVALKGRAEPIELFRLSWCNLPTE